MEEDFRTYFSCTRFLDALIHSAASGFPQRFFNHANIISVFARTKMSLACFSRPSPLIDLSTREVVARFDLLPLNGAGPSRHDREPNLLWNCENGYDGAS
jgi:hypothetical protein